MEPKHDGDDEDVFIHLEDIGDLEGVPDAIIVTNMDPHIFDSFELQNEFEKVFRENFKFVNIKYLECFRRARLEFRTPYDAAVARIHFNGVKFGEKEIKCFFAQPVETAVGEAYLTVPAPLKQFLISPPASPPVGWEQVKEHHPVVDIELIAALASLAPEQVHEIIEATEHHPGVIVSTCDDDEDSRAPKPKFVQTPRPSLGE